ncbi:hypothetical protein Y032_0058g2868 [Ancylostoma ceylanicum]|nr:hypothetical protein Y032_0058g2868 [Ancylostoma ceylanicum]
MIFIASLRKSLITNGTTLSAHLVSYHRYDHLEFSARGDRLDSEMTIWRLYKAKQEAHAALNKFLFEAENAKREQQGISKLLTTKQKVKRFLSPIYPPWKENFVPFTFYDRIFSNGTIENAVARLVRNIIILESFGMVMYFVLSYKYASRPENVGIALSIVIHTFLVFMFLFPALMSYFMLAVHQMISTKIRTLLLLLMISMSFEGPAMNAVTNIHRVAEGIACVQADVTLALNDVKCRAGDVKDVIANKLQDLIVKLAVPINKIRGILRKLDSKLRRVVEAIRRQFRSLANLTNLCTRFMKKPYVICKNFFEKMFIACVSKDNVISLPGCDTIKRSSKVCDMVGAGVENSVCIFPTAAKEVVVNGYFYLMKKALSFGSKTAENTLFFRLESVKQVAKAVKKEVLDVRNLQIHYHSAGEGAEDLAVHNKLKKSLVDVVENYILMFETMQAVIKWIFVPMTLFWPFVSTALFTFKFNYREEYENNYLTDEFDRIDLDMALKGRTKALPLNKEEQLLYIPRNSWRMTTREKAFYRLRVIMTLILSATPFCFICMDQAVYMVLSNVFYFMTLINIEYPSHYEVKVSGKGQAAEMIRSFQNMFSPLTTDIKERDERWRNCFNEPTPPDDYTLWNIILMFIAAMFLCRFQVWMSRQSLALADHFFPDRVRPRALTLYNRILQDRKNLLAAVMQDQKRQLADDQMEGRETVVRRGLQSRGFIRVNCTICNEADLRLADQANTRLCVKCGAFYCIQCFCLRRYCKECQNDMQLIDRVELYYEDISDDEESDEEVEQDIAEEDLDDQSESKLKVSGMKFP